MNSIEPHLNQFCLDKHAALVVQQLFERDSSFIKQKIVNILVGNLKNGQINQTNLQRLHSDVNGRRVISSILQASPQEDKMVLQHELTNIGRSQH